VGRKTYYVKQNFKLSHLSTLRSTSAIFFGILLATLLLDKDGAQVKAVFKTEKFYAVSSAAFAIANAGHLAQDMAHDIHEIV
jgi:hypothetical protein